MVSGSGRQRGHPEVHRGAEYDVVLVPKVRPGETGGAV